MDFLRFFAGNGISFFKMSITIKQSLCKHFLSSGYDTFGVSIEITLHTVVDSYY